MMKKYIYGHTNFDNAYEVDNYPWGFRLKTKVRYWIETSDKSNGGQRFCKCTLNPKTNAWCAPKKSTYGILSNMYLDENDYVQYESISLYHCEEETLNKYIENHKDHLGSYEIANIKLLKARNEVLKNVEYKFENVTYLSEEERRIRRETNDKNERIIASAIYNKAKSIDI